MQNAASIRMRIKNELSVPKRRDWHTETLNQYFEILAKLDNRLQTFVEEETKVRADRFLSDDGKRVRLIQAGTTFITGLGWLARVLEALDNFIADYRRAYFAVPPAQGDAVLDFLRLREVRDRLLILNPTQRAVAYVQASERNDELVMRAIATAPGPDGPWVDATTKEKTDATRAQRLDLDGYRKFEQAKMLLESVASLREHLSVWSLHLGVSQSTLVAVFCPMDTGVEIGTPAASPRQTDEEVSKVIVAHA